MKIGMVGTGRMAVRHLQALTGMGGIAVVGHVSHERHRAEAQADQWGGNAYTDIVPLLERERPDAVWLCVLPNRHGKLEEALIASETPFFVEKPLALDLETPMGLLALLVERPLVTGVGYKFRAMSTIPRLRDLLKVSPPRMLVGSWHSGTPSLDWWQDEAQSGGQMVEQVTHLVDLVRCLIGEGIVLGARTAYHTREAFPSCTVATVHAALLQFAGTVPMTLTATCLLERSQPATLQLICDGQMLTVTDRWLRIENAHGVEEVAMTADLFQVEDAAFVRAVRERNPELVLSSYADAVNTQALCVALAHPV